MMREWPYTASSRDILGCTSPPTSRFPSALEMSLGLRPQDISRASGNLLVVGDVQPNTSLYNPIHPSTRQCTDTMFMISSCLSYYCGSIGSVKINTSLLMMRECIRTLPRGGMYWGVHPRRPRDFPRPERCPDPEGKARGTSRGPREISRSEGMYNPFSHHWQGSIDFNTVRTTRPTGMYFLIHP